MPEQQLVRAALGFPKERRLRKRSEFRRVQAAARRVTTPHFLMLIHHPSEAPASTRLGITASRKVGPAVVRNRVKRLIREAFRATPWLWSPAVDLVVVVRSFGREMSLANVTGEWEAARDRITRCLGDAPVAPKVDRC